MATKAQSGDFISNLGRIYGFYTGGFAAFVILLAILEQVGVPNRIIGYLFVFFTIAVYAIIGIMSRTAQVSEYYVAGRRVPAFYNGMATGADWMSAASFIGMAGTLYALGYDGLAFVLGWTGGYVLVAVLIAPFLRKFGAFTVPDFLSARYGGNVARMIGVIVLFCCSFTYVTAQIYGTGIIASRFLGMSFEVAVFVGLIGILLCSMLGGMRAVTWTQVAQYIVLIVAYLIPVIILSAKDTGIPIPQLTYGSALQQITELEQQMVANGLASAEAIKLHVEPFTSYTPLNFFGLILCLMVGTASLPHILMRYFTTPSVREARISCGWSLFFIFLLYFTAPAYAAFAKLEVYQNVIGSQFTALPDWIRTYSNLGLVTIQGLTLQAAGQAMNLFRDAIAGGAADVTAAVAAVTAKLQAANMTAELKTFTGIADPVKALLYNAVAANPTASSSALLLGEGANPGIWKEVFAAAAQAAGNTTGQLSLTGLKIDNDVIVISTPEIAGMPYVIAGLVAAGGLAAALSTADGLLLAIANALSHDVYYKMVDPQASTTRRLTVARVLLVVVAIGAASLASTKPSDILSMVAWAFSLAAAGNFPALVLGIWSKRVNSAGAVAGMIAGFGICLAYLIGTQYGFDFAKGTGDEWSEWFGVKNISAALFGLPVGFIVMYGVSLMTKAPSKEMQDMIDEIRKPRGQLLMEGGNLVKKVS